MGLLSKTPEFDSVVGISPANDAGHSEYAELLSKRSGGRFSAKVASVPTEEKRAEEFEEALCGKEGKFDAVFLPHVLWIACRDGTRQDFTYPGSYRKLNSFVSSASRVLHPGGRLYLVEYCSRGDGLSLTDRGRFLSALETEGKSERAFFAGKGLFLEVEKYFPLDYVAGYLKDA